jgi:phenylpropionate dioxygenase-like ring-hydroxylating dioxygenase large terminal subunit
MARSTDSDTDSNTTNIPQFLLPREAYLSQEWFDREQVELFGRTWQFAGMTDELREPGDYIATRAGAFPIVAIVGADGVRRAFHNICRHRGAQLLEEGSGKLGRELSCFYHSWAYDLAGDLKRIPQPKQFPQMDLACMSLRPASVDVWKGMVYIHADPAAEPLMDWVGGMDEAMGPYEPEQLQQLSIDHMDVEANWKLFVENHIDGYHLWHLHRTSVKGFDHNRQAARAIGRHWSLYEPPQRPEQGSPTAGLGLKPIPGLDARWSGSIVHLMFPNTGIASGGEYWLTLHVVPLSPERTRVTVRTRGMPLTPIAAAGLAATGALAKIKQRSDGWRRPGAQRTTHPSTGDITAEDKRAAEAIQAAMHSPAFSVGPMAIDYEQAITDFQRNVLHYVTPSA